MAEKGPISSPLNTAVLQKEEPGVAGGDFRTKLQRTAATKINTAAAFPQAKTGGAQVDFRNVLKKSTGPEKKVIKTGGSAQTDFRGSLKKTPQVKWR